ncbi:hypothetical protein [Sinomicrobium weinanense]|uniref:TonB C-terminal domain-containing protein n=1 Tax=Sinomicrobium weinanense TaxID=2842200 RepID=A0A926Q4C6_9FLAO|nr:hypothetical protein [Sinomicrobium weinanense]MBC9798442.1 hypothetical protein [Sinomicrobium weinanense]MBU3125198.1 energy transducer TonB [Sinomicrobium weinanense]
MRKTGDFFFAILRYDLGRFTFMRILMWGVLLAAISSCNRNKEKIAADQLVRDEIENINWNEIDRYPMFDTCDETANKEQQKQCFERTFIQHLYAGIEDQQVAMHGRVSDTVYVRFLISNTGKVSVSEIEQSDRIEKRLPDLDSIIDVSLTKMPGLYPALKRNIPVATKYRLPIVLDAVVSSSAAP